MDEVAGLGYGVPDFGKWQLLTGYKENQSNGPSGGGPQFQKLMHALLTEDPNIEVKQWTTDIEKGSVRTGGAKWQLNEKWTEEVLATNVEWNTGMRQHLKPGSAQKPGLQAAITTGRNTGFSKMYGVSKLMGANTPEKHLGYWAMQDRPFRNPGDLQNNQPAFNKGEKVRQKHSAWQQEIGPHKGKPAGDVKPYVAGVPMQPMTKFGAAHAFHLMAKGTKNGVETRGIIAGSQGNWAKSTGFGDLCFGKDGPRPQEGRPPLTLSMRFAAFFGLYFYPGCESGGRHTRKPNPNYALVTGKDVGVYVQEPVHEPGRDDLVSLAELKKCLTLRDFSDEVVEECAGTDEAKQAHYAELVKDSHNKTELTRDYGNREVAVELDRWLAQARSKLFLGPFWDHKLKAINWQRGETPLARYGLIKLDAMHEYGQMTRAALMWDKHGDDPTNARLSTLIAWFSGNEEEWDPSAEWFTDWSRQRVNADRAGWERNHGTVHGTDMYSNTKDNKQYRIAPNGERKVAALTGPAQRLICKTLNQELGHVFHYAEPEDLEGALHFGFFAHTKLRKPGDLLHDLLDDSKASLGLRSDSVKQPAAMFLERPAELHQSELENGVAMPNNNRFDLSLMFGDSDAEEDEAEVEVQVGKAAPAPSNNAAGSSAEHAGGNGPEEAEEQPMDLDADDEAGDDETAEVGRKAGMPGDDEEVLGAEDSAEELEDNNAEVGQEADADYTRPEVVEDFEKGLDSDKKEKRQDVPRWHGAYGPMRSESAYPRKQFDTGSDNSTGKYQYWFRTDDGALDEQCVHNDQRCCLYALLIYAYWAEQARGGEGSKMKISGNTVELGNPHMMMLNGVARNDKRPTGKRKAAADAARVAQASTGCTAFQVGDNPRSKALIWNAVFVKEPSAVDPQGYSVLTRWCKAAWDNKAFCQTLDRVAATGVQELRTSTATRFFGKAQDEVFVKRLLDRMTRDKLAPMKLIEWVSTPWHYNHLGAVSTESLFTANEDFQAGCKRCNRPFYERECLLHPVQVEDDNPRGLYVHQQLWYKTEDEGRSCSAPLTLADILDDKNYTIGWNGYGPTRQYITETDFEPFQTVRIKWGKLILASKLNQKLKGGRGAGNIKVGIEDTNTKDKIGKFRVFHNYCYSDGPTAKRAIRQGRLGGGRSVLFGHSGYKLERFNRYSNVCHDCKAVIGSTTLWQRKDLWVSTLPRPAKDDTASTGLTGTPDERKKRLTALAEQLAAKGRRVPRAHAANIEGILDAEEKRIFADFELPDTPTQRYDSKYRASGGPTIVTQAFKTVFDGGKAGADIVLAETALGKLLSDIRLNKPNLGADLLPDEIQSLRGALGEMARALENRRRHVENKGGNLSVVDTEETRLELRNKTVDIDGTPVDNCLVVLQHHTYTEEEQRAAAGAFDPDMATEVPVTSAQDYKDRKCTKDCHQLAEDIMSNIERRVYQPDEYEWAKDMAAADPTNKQAGRFGGKIEGKDPTRQERERRQSRFWITYALHRAVRPIAPSGATAGEDGAVETEAEQVMRKMADGVHWLFSNERLLASMFVFGQKLEKKDARKGGDGADLGSSYHWVPIKKPRKPDREPYFYADDTSSSYMYDNYWTHVESVEVDCGVEIGPQRKHPHFHMLMTVDHWTYLHFDYYVMRAYLEMMFKGIDSYENGQWRYGWKGAYTLQAYPSMEPFYPANEVPYIQFKLAPADNYSQIIAGYIRKDAGAIVEAGRESVQRRVSMLPFQARLNEDRRQGARAPLSEEEHQRRAEDGLGTPSDEEEGDSIPRRRRGQAGQTAPVQQAPPPSRAGQAGPSQPQTDTAAAGGDVPLAKRRPRRENAGKKG